MADRVTIEIEGQVHEFPVLTGSEGEQAIDISDLRARTGYITMDPAYMNTGATTSAVTFLDGEQGILRYRGIPIEQVAEHSSFTETAYLLIYGRLPTRAGTDRLPRPGESPLDDPRGPQGADRPLSAGRAPDGHPVVGGVCACPPTTRSWPKWTRHRTRSSCPSCA